MYEKEEEAIIMWEQIMSSEKNQKIILTMVFVCIGVLIFTIVSRFRIDIGREII